MNKETIKQYINELKLQREAVASYDKECIILEWYDKQICYFENRLKELEGQISIFDMLGGNNE